MDNRLYLSPKQLAERWAGIVGKQTLCLWRKSGKGPKYMKVGGKIMYPIDFVREYEQKSIKNGAGSP